MPFSFAAGTLLPGSFRLFRCYAVRCAFVVAVVLPAVSQSQTIRYIKPVASGDGSGSSWANASANLKAMMDTAPANSQVWVAAGTYYPTISVTDRNASFVMKNQVAVYGGFAGTETALAQRSGGASILSGNIGDPGNNGDNSYHVIANVNNNLDNTAILDGFTVSGGNANSGSSGSEMAGGGYYANGGGAPVLRRIIFEQNSANTQGGGMYVAFGAIVLDSCIIRNNTSYSTAGGAVFETCNAVLTACQISNNNSFNNTGGLLLSGNATPTLTRCMINDNTATITGGILVRNAAILTSCFIVNNTANTDAAMSVLGATQFLQCVFYNNKVPDVVNQSSVISINLATPKFVNCSFIFNRAGSTSGWLLYAYSKLNIVITNCLFRGNVSSTFYTANNLGGFWQDGFVVTYSINNDAMQGATNFNSRVDLVDQLNPAGADGIYGTSDDGLMPVSCSLSQDIGNDADATFTTDIAGNPRKVKGRPRTQLVDAGAYELQTACAPTSNRLYVKVNNNFGNQTGNSWTDAFFNLDEALSWAALYPVVTEIWVAVGTYTPTRGTDRNASFGLRNNLAIYGSFAGTESNLSQRSLTGNRSILSGNIGDAGSSSDNSFHIVTAGQGGLNNTAILDGFTIREGVANNGGSDGGGGMLMTNGNPLISNCLFLQNYGVAGGAVRNINAAPAFTNCVFNGNNASVGGAMYCEGGGQVVVQQCVITGNSAISGGVSNTYEGGGISYINCTIHNNSASYYGVCYTTFSGAYFTNCIIWGNSSFAGEDEGGATGVSNSLLSFPYGGANNKVGDPNFPNAADPDGADNRWGTTDDGLRLGLCTQAANMGNDAWMALTLDFKGQPRKFGVVDAGAYEAQVTPPTALYARPSASGSNQTGTSWANAITNLNTALANWTNCPTADSLLLSAQSFTANATNVFEVNKPGGIMIGNYDPSTGQRLPGYNAYLYGDLILRTPIRMEGFVINPKP